MNRKNVCVFCASSRNAPEKWLAAARELGAGLAGMGIGLVYGGASIGMMGALADSALAHGGRVTGVIPEWLRIKEVAHPGLSELIVTAGMHQRKMTMFGMSEAFVAAPGGMGTLEETLEIITWKQLGMHIKPIILLNMDRFFDPLLSQFETGRAENLLREEAFGLWKTETSVEGALKVIRTLFSEEAHTVQRRSTP